MTAAPSDSHDVIGEDNNSDVGAHAPTITVALLRQAASMLRTASNQLPTESIFFPPRTGDELQPVILEGYLGLNQIAGLVEYLADMVEV